VTAPTAPRLATRPALAAYLRHANHCPAGGDLRRCNDCRGLNADASAESWRTAATREKTQRG
jgi:hypothetical protein